MLHNMDFGQHPVAITVGLATFVFVLGLRLYFLKRKGAPAWLRWLGAVVAGLCTFFYHILEAVVIAVVVTVLTGFGWIQFFADLIQGL